MSLVEPTDNGERSEGSVSGGSQDETLFQITPGAPATGSGSSASVTGTVSFGARFEMGTLLGKGGMGEVYEASDRYLNRTVAIKRLLRFDQEHTARFVRECQLNGRLEHPNIGIVYELGFEPNGTPYLVMRRFEGTTLRNRLAEIRFRTKREANATNGASERPAELLKLLDIFRVVCDATAYANQRGIVHRDINPDNIMVGDFGEVSLVDWGLAKDLHDENAEQESPPEQSAPARTESESTLPSDYDPPRTADGKTLGTLGFMAPEQARGEWDQVDQRADVFSLGATLYTILSGCHPFEGKPKPAIYSSVIKGTRPSFDELPHKMPWTIPWELRAVVNKAMSPKPEERYASATELSDEIARYLSGLPLNAPYYEIKDRLKCWLRRHRRKIRVVGALLFVIGISFAAGIAVWERQRAEEQRWLLQQLDWNYSLDVLLNEQMEIETLTNDFLATHDTEVIMRIADQFQTGEEALHALGEGDMRFIGKHYEKVGILIKYGYVNFDAFFDYVAFPDRFWQATAEFRKHVRERNWSGNGRGLPDFWANFEYLHTRYEAAREKARRTRTNDPQ